MVVASGTIFTIMSVTVNANVIMVVQKHLEGSIQLGKYIKKR